MATLFQSAVHIARRSPLRGPLERVDDYIRRRGQRQHIRRWDAQVAPLPVPDIVKQERLLSLAKRYQLTTLVETGTYLGDMIGALHGVFTTCYTIELSVPLADRAQRRFRRWSNVTVLQGDSGQVLSTLLPKLGPKTLFWLDAHYSAGFTARGPEESPALHELKAILTSTLRDFVIVVDDAADFGGVGGYPTIEHVRALVAEHAPTYQVVVHHNAISILPKE